MYEKCGTPLVIFSLRKILKFTLPVITNRHFPFISFNFGPCRENSKAGVLYLLLIILFAKINKSTSAAPPVVIPKC